MRSAVVFPRSNLSRQDYEDWKRLNTTLSSLEVYTGTGYSVARRARRRSRCRERASAMGSSARWA